MPLTRITCPECGAGLKSATGFTVGQTIACPKCETDFTVEEPVREATAARQPVRAVADRGEGDRPKKKKKRPRVEDDEDGNDWSYKSSWIRYAVLGVLVVVMLVLAYMLYQKRQREKEEAQALANTDAVPRPTVVQRG